MNIKQHSLNVEKLSLKIGSSLKLSKHELEELSLSALLHDIGKFIIPKDILFKPEKLNPLEWNKMKLHPSIGAQFLKTKGFNEKIIEGVLYHHERYDGKGYLYNIEGENIPLYARIIAVADSFDAMTSNRPYSEKIDEFKALKEIISCSGTQFDPQIVNSFLNCFDI